MTRAKELAKLVVAKFHHYEGGIEWVSNPSPDELREAISAALTRAEQEGEARGIEKAAQFIESKDLGTDGTVNNCWPIAAALADGIRSLPPSEPGAGEK